MLESPLLSDFLIAHPLYLYAILALLGLIVGSFLNVVILRVPEIMRREWCRDCRELLEMEPEPDNSDTALSLSFPGSHCPKCGCPIKPWHNIPVISYLLLRGRCASCDTAISWRYPFVEAGTAVLTVVIGIHVGWGLELLTYLLFTWALIALSGIDIDTQLLPDNITLPLLWGGLLFNLFIGPVSLSDAVLGAACGYLLLWSVYWLFKLVTGKEGMGFGDFKLLAALGAWLGWQSLPVIILLSSAVGAVLGILIIVMRGQSRAQPLPFGPYLAAAGWISLVWGDAITTALFGPGL